MVLVDSGVEYGDLDAGAVITGGPGGRSADLRHAPVEGGPASAVQPHLLHRRRSGELGRSLGIATGGAGVGHGVPELGAARLDGAHGLAVDDGERTADACPGPGERAHRGCLAAPEGDDQRQVGPARVVVAVRHQLGDVEQPSVQLALRQQQLRVAWHNLSVPGDHPDRERHPLPALRPLNPGDAAGAVHLNPVAGDQRHRLHRLGPTGALRALGHHPRMPADRRGLGHPARDTGQHEDRGSHPRRHGRTPSSPA